MPLKGEISYGPGVSDEPHDVKYFPNQNTANESFYNKKVLLNIVEGEFYIKDEESIVLALYLLAQKKSSVSETIIKKLLENYSTK